MSNVDDLEYRLREAEDEVIRRSKAFIKELEAKDNEIAALRKIIRIYESMQPSLKES
jgi:flagellar motility protein MotE (MotC chaperone)